MGTLSLYTQERQGGLRNFSMGSFSTTDLVRNEDYQENYCKQFNVSSLGRDIWAVRLTLSNASFRNLNVNIANQPFAAPTLKVEGNYIIASNNDLNAPALAERPADWDVHWRDKYYKKYPRNVQDAQHNEKIFYASGNTLPVSSGGEMSAPPFVPNEYYATNQGRYLFWTMGNVYFTILSQWKYNTQTKPEYYVGFADPTYSPNNDEWYYVNTLREGGMLGPHIMNQYNAVNFRAAMSQEYSSYGEQEPHIFLNFISFNYDIDVGGGEIQTKEMIGVCVWTEAGDGSITNAIITGYEKELFAGTPEPPNDGPSSGPQGGHGTFSAPSDNRGDRSGATAAAIASLWNSNTMTAGYNNYYISPVAPAAFQEMCERLWDPDILESWANQAQSPLQAIITCHQVPANLAQVNLGTPQIIKAAGLGLSDTTADTFSQYITSYHVGDVDISQYTDAFPDFTDSSIYIHLPYIGTYQLDTAACMHGWLAVDYLCDLTSGHCTALITTMDKFGNTQIRYEFKGDCSKTVPLYQRENPWANVWGSVLPSLVNVGVAAITGGVGGALAGQAASSALGDVFEGKFPTAQEALLVSKTSQALGAAKQIGVRAGAIGSALGTIGSSATATALSGSGTVQSNASGGDVSSPIDTMCWLLITRPQWSAPELYSRERAYPSDISQTVGEFSGLLVVSSCELNGIDCTDDELHEIDSWLKTGVLLD